MSQIIVLAEHDSGTLVKGSLVAVSAAKELAEKLGGTFDIAVAGQGIDSVAAELAGYGAATVYQLEDASLANYTAQAYAQAFDTAVRQAGAQYVLAAATSRGKDCTLESLLTQGGPSQRYCSHQRKRGSTHLHTTHVGGCSLGDVKVNTDITVLTVRTTAFDAAASTGSKQSSRKDGCRR